MNDKSDSARRCIHALLVQLCPGMLFSGRQAIANEVAIMVEDWEKNGLKNLREHLAFQEGNATGKQK